MGNAEKKAARKPRPLTQADWDKVHASCVKAELNPDPAQITLIDMPAAVPASKPDES